jgi:hypothetical protein
MGGLHERYPLPATFNRRVAAEPRGALADNREDASLVSVRLTIQGLLLSLSKDGRSPGGLANHGWLSSPQARSLKNQNLRSFWTRAVRSPRLRMGANEKSIMLGGTRDFAGAPRCRDRKRGFAEG